MEEEKIYEVVLGRNDGMLSVVCLGCGRRHYGNALEGFLRSGQLMTCRDDISFLGCDAKLRLKASS